MSAEQDRLEELQAEPRPQNSAPANASREIERPLIDREVVPPRADAQYADVAVEDRTELFEPTLLTDFNARWSAIQAGFVDEPRRAVQEADALVSDVIQRITDSFGAERVQLEQQWDRGNDVSTEDLRQALRRYRSFFSRLLSI